MRGAFVTYNNVGDGSLASGWHSHEGREVLLLQNTRGYKWAVQEPAGGADRPPPGYDRDDTENVRAVKSQIEQLWDALRAEADSLDFIVIYLGASGSERFIELAQGLPASKVTFVGCDCELGLKTRMIREAGLWEAGRIICECGGRRTLGHLLKRYLYTGQGPNFEA
jgi:hypothetical protein